MFASQKKEDVKVGDVTVRVRKLSGRSLEAASDARQARVAVSARQLGAELIKAFRPEEDKAKQEDTKPEVELTPEQRAKARYDAYDRDSVLTAGIDSWDAPNILPDHKGKFMPLVEGIKDLDEETAEQLKKAILDLSLPPLDPAVLEGNA